MKERVSKADKAELRRIVIVVVGEVLKVIQEFHIERVTFEAEMSCPDGAVDPVEYSEFELWREFHKTHKDPGGDTIRCPRCYSTRVKIDENYARCLSCRYSIYLWDFPETRVVRNE